MGRYTQDSFTTASIGAGATLTLDRDISADYIDIHYISLIPSVVSGSTVVSIHTKSARGAGDLLYETLGWAGASFTDPIEDVGGVYNPRNEGFVCRYEDEDGANKLYLSIFNDSGDAKTYDVVISYVQSPFTASVTGVPGDLYARAVANLLTCASGVEARVNNVGITEAEFRAKYYAYGSLFPESVDLRTVAEGGTFAHNGTTNLVITGIPADKTGAQHYWTSLAQGRWYFAWKLKNGVGWSVWTDGNDTPSEVTQWFETNTNEDNGPPAGWQVTIEKADATNYYIVRATRPRTNGNVIMWWSAQVKDTSSGSWRAVDANAGAAQTKYDGSGANHTYDPTTNTLTTPGTWGTAAVGDLILYDVRGDTNWTLANCCWCTVSSISGTDIHVYGGGGRLALLSTAHQTLGIYDQIRLKIVKGPWEWNTEGYLGDQINRGFWEGRTEGLGIPPLLDKTTKTFVSEPIYISPAHTAVGARVWFQNTYSRSDDGVTVSSGISGGPGIITDGWTWYAFNDRDWWVPSCQQADNVRLTLETDGTVTSGPNALLPATSNAFGASGVVGRFKIYPTVDGKIQIRAKWTVNLQSGTVEAISSTLAMIMDTDQMHLYPTTSRDTTPPAYGFHRYYSASGPVYKLVFAHRRGWAYNNFQDFNASAIITEDYDPAPGMPCDVELRLTIQEDVTSFTEKCVVWKTYEYQVAGGGWNTIALTPGAYMYELRTPLMGLWGYIPALIYHQEAAVPGDYATLKEFQVAYGVLARI